MFEKSPERLGKKFETREAETASKIAPLAPPVLGLKREQKKEVRSRGEEDGKVAHPPSSARDIPNFRNKRTKGAPNGLGLPGDEVSKSTSNLEGIIRSQKLKEQMRKGSSFKRPSSAENKGKDGE